MSLPKRGLSSGDIAIAGASYVIASTTLVSDLSGWMTFGWSFVWPVVAALVVNLLVCLSVAELSASFPRCGAIYSFASAVFEPRFGHRAFGIFLAITFVGMTCLAGAGEISSGAVSLRALVGSNLDTSWFVLALVLGALAPNLLGVSMTARVTLVAVIVMVGLRWGFGLVGFLGVSNADGWASARLGAVGGTDAQSALLGGLGLAFWTFVGVEAVAPFAEETRGPRVLARGMTLALLLVFVTSLSMGIGITGAFAPDARRALLASPASCGGNCPQIGVGLALLGVPGGKLMALAAAAACYGTVVIGIAGIARVLHALTRDGRVLAGAREQSLRPAEPGPLPGPPRAALVLTALLVVIPPLFAQEVLEWLLPAALIWLALYVVFNLLVAVDRLRAPDRPRPLRLPLWVPIAGALAAALATPVVFRETDLVGTVGRAGIVLVGAAALTALLLVTERACGTRLPAPPVGRDG